MLHKLLRKVSNLRSKFYFLLSFLTTVFLFMTLNHFFSPESRERVTVCLVCCVTSCAQTHKLTLTLFLLCNEQKNKSAVSSVLCPLAVY